MNYINPVATRVMNLRRNVAANYVSQVYVTLVGVLILPMYVKLLGAEAFGLVGFFTLLQACFGLLDLGLTPTIGRETARFRAGAVDSVTFRRLFRALSIIFAGVALIGGGALFLSSREIAGVWLNVKTLPVAEVGLAVRVMAISIALRWMGGLYRGVVTGSERLVWLSAFNITFATLRFIVVLPVMWRFGYTPIVFFVHQLVVATIEALALWWQVRRLLPEIPPSSPAIGWSLAPIRPVLKFALIIAFTTAVWVFVTQVDKIVLSKILPLAEYGYFTLAVMAAGGVMVVSGPISNSIMPRMAKLHAERNHDELIRIYRRSTQFVAIVAGSAAITLTYCAHAVAYAWTGNSLLAAEVAPILRLYGIGNGFLSVAAFAYYLQYAKGSLRYHLIGNAGLVLILIPSIIGAATRFGAIGAGYVWLSMNAAYFFLWVAYVHRKLEPGLHVKWLTVDLLRVLLPPIAMASLITLIGVPVSTRVGNGAYVVLVGAVTIVMAALCSGFRKDILLRGKGWITKWSALRA